MNQSFVLSIWRPKTSTKEAHWTSAYNALTGAVIRADTFNWVSVELPERDYRVEYRLDPNGEFQATASTQGFSKDLYPVILHRVGQRSGLGICTCFLPLDWVGKTFTRRVLPLEPEVPFELPLPAVCVYCGATWGDEHGPECVTQGVRPLHAAPDDSELYGTEAETIQADRLQEDKP